MKARSTGTGASPGSSEKRGTGPVGFSETKFWRPFGNGWQRVFGSFKGSGYSIEWHDFQTARDLDWGASFHPGSIEVCLNLAGHGYVRTADTLLEIEPETVAFYHRGQQPLEARRVGGERHQFLTVEFAPGFLREHLPGAESVLHPLVRAAIEGRPVLNPLGPAGRLTVEQRQMVETLRHPPVYAAAQPIWYQCKAVELAVLFLFRPPPEAELFCTRQQRLAQERVDRVIEILKQNLADPPSLEELGRRVGCSPFYLSRIFSAQTGRTIPQYLRQLRLERAAELLRTGRYNVTEVALEVGYNSLSHFSQAFHEYHGCCPGLYPVRTPTQSQAMDWRVPQPTQPPPSTAPGGNPSTR